MVVYPLVKLGANKIVVVKIVSLCMISIPASSTQI